MWFVASYQLSLKNHFKDGLPYNIYTLRIKVHTTPSKVSQDDDAPSATQDTSSNRRQDRVAVSGHNSSTRRANLEPYDATSAGGITGLDRVREQPQTAIRHPYSVIWRLYKARHFKIEHGSFEEPHDKPTTVTQVHRWKRQLTCISEMEDSVACTG